ncbi:MAG TPA: hypothetical protein VJN90_02640 [Candidatus Acidoferrales bacterium]|nr:hypothetical protein [Candidatus Acidoferrales bacterium]
MYIFTMVNDVKRAMEQLRAERGEFTLAMLYNSEMESPTSNLIVSAPWTDKLGIREATHVIARALTSSLSPENRRSIARITVLKTSDPFVCDMITRIYPKNVPIPQVTAGPVTEGSGYILYSQKVA